VTVSLDGAIGALQGKSITEMDGGMNSPRRFLFRFSCSLVFYCFLFFLFLLSIYISMLFFFLYWCVSSYFPCFVLIFPVGKYALKAQLSRHRKRGHSTWTESSLYQCKRNPRVISIILHFSFSNRNLGKRPATIQWVDVLSHFHGFFGSLFSSILGYSSSFFEISFRLLYFY